MGSQNWKPRVGLVSLTFEYYVDLDDEEMVESAKECCLADARDVSFQDDYRCQVEEVRENPDDRKLDIIDPFLEVQVERLLDQNKCPYCKGTLVVKDHNFLWCENCDEDWDNLT